MIGRRGALSALLAAPLAGCGGDGGWHGIDVAGTSPDLAFVLERAPGGQRTTAADLRGDVTLLYFGYTNCPDLCPLTMQNAATAFSRMGAAAHDVKFLFVTVDPGRDTLASLGAYVALFGPEFIGLRGTPDQLERLARRFRVAYAVTPATASQPVAVVHTSILYVFDRAGRARLIVPSLDAASADVAGLAADLRRLVRTRSGPSWLERIV